MEIGDARKREEERKGRGEERRGGSGGRGHENRVEREGNGARTVGWQCEGKGRGEGRSCVS